MTAHTLLHVADRSQVPETRQAARVAAERAGFSETDAHRVGIVATELATNLVKHAGQGGYMLLVARTDPAPEVELLAVDRGPGMADIARSLADGYSTSGSSGSGLGAVRRLADDFDIYSQPGKGTVVLARMRRAGGTSTATALQVGGVSVAMTGESVCGDAWMVTADRGRTMIGIADGLGHGQHASVAASTAVRAMSSQAFSTTVQMLTAAHEAIRHTRGAAAAVTFVDPRATIVTAAGVGNIATAIVGDESIRQAVSLGGILGHEVRQFREYQYPWIGGALLVMHSDGLISHWSLDGYPGLRQRHPALVAAVLYRDYQRGRDDVTVVVGRNAA